jgi:hypothetical protein
VALDRRVLDALRLALSNTSVRGVVRAMLQLRRIQGSARMILRKAGRRGAFRRGDRLGHARGWTGGAALRAAMVHTPYLALKPLFRSCAVVARLA